MEKERDASGGGGIAGNGKCQAQNRGQERKKAKRMEGKERKIRGEKAENKK